MLYINEMWVIEMSALTCDTGLCRSNTVSFQHYDVNSRSSIWRLKSVHRYNVRFPVVLIYPIIICDDTLLKLGSIHAS